MSRQIDPTNLSSDDLEYIKQRPSLRQEIIQQGYGDPLAEDFEGRQDASEDDGREAAELRERVDELTKENEELRRQNSELQTQLNDVNSGVKEEHSLTDQHTDGTDTLDDLPAEKQWNEEMTKDQLQAVIDARNEDYEGDEKIVVDGSKKGDLVAALQQDDSELLG